MQISQKTLNFAFVIELEKHIEILLLSYECVIVPGLGGFMTHHVEARYDEGDNLFLPPLRTLGFNPQLKLNDSLIAQSYIEAYDISYPEAIRRIEEEVNELRQHIHNEGSYELNDIGTLYINEEGCYQFEPCEAGVLTPELYGLSSFEMPEYHHRANIIGNTSKTESIKASTKNINTPFLSLPPNNIPDKEAVDNNEENNVIKIKVAWIRNTIAVAAALLAFFMITPPISNSNQNNANIGNLQNNILSQLLSHDKSISTAKIDTEKFKKDVGKEDSIIRTPRPEIMATAKTESVKTSKGSEYCIVMASHVTPQNADAYVNELHANGYEEAHVYVHNNIVRVVYGNYKKEAEAYMTLHTIRGSKYFEQAWIYKKK